jgi:hypothetical protein
MKSLPRVIPIRRSARYHPEPDLGEGELGPERRDPEVARHRQLEPGAHREAVDGREHRLPAPLRRRQRVAPQLEIGRGLIEELRDVAARAEGLAARTTDHDDPDRVVGLQLAEDAGELVAHRNRHRVHLGLAVDPERGDGTAPLRPQGLAHR